jgi:hypothetical protein
VENILRARAQWKKSRCCQKDVLVMHQIKTGRKIFFGLNKYGNSIFHFLKTLRQNGQNKVARQVQVWQPNMQTYFEIVMNLVLVRDEVKTCRKTVLQTCT